METPAPAAHRPEPVVHEVVGPPLAEHEVAAAIAIGVISLILAGVMSMLLSGLADEHRLSAQGIGLTAMLEALVMGLSTGACGIFLKPARLRLIGAIACVALAAIDLTMTRLGGPSVILVRGLAGVPEGVLLWITIGMIARTETPERWAGVLFTALTAAQFALAMVFTFWVVPVFHANGGFIGVAAIILLGVFVAWRLPDRYAPLPDGGDDGGPPPLRGWIALIGTLIFVSSVGAIGIYTVAFAKQAGLSPGVGRFAVTAALAAQILGGALATGAAGRIHYFRVFIAGSIISLAVLAVYAGAAPAWLFVVATMVYGGVNMFITPFLVPMTIEADPSRRAAVQSGAAQLFGAALGPLAAAFVVSDKDLHGALYFGAALLLVGLGIIAGLHFTARPAPAA
jgi:hypothetical protein